MTEFEAASFYALSRFACTSEGDFLLENFQSTVPHDEFFDLEQDLPF